MRSDPINPPVSTARRPRRGLLRDVPRIALLAVALLAVVGAASAAAASGAIVHVDSRSVPVTWTVIGGGTASGTYQTPSGQSRPVRGTSIRDLLSGANVDLASVDTVTVAGVSLTRAEVASGLPAVFALSLGSTRFVRDASNVDAPDAVTYPAGAQIDVTVQSSAPPQAAPGTTYLTITAFASTTRANVGEVVGFNAQSDASSGAFYSWSFGDGVSPPATTSAAVPHTYRGPCDCLAAVTVTDAQGGSGRATVRVQVGHPQRTTAGSGLGTSNATGNGAGGSGTGKGGTGGGTDTGGKGATQPRPSPSKAAVKPVARPGAAAKAAPAPAAAGASQPVSGILLADVGSPLDLRLSPPPPSGSPGAAHKSAGGLSGIGAVLAGLALALAIAGLGGFTERRRATLRPA